MVTPESDLLREKQDYLCAFFICKVGDNNSTNFIG